MLMLLLACASNDNAADTGTDQAEPWTADVMTVSAERRFPPRAPMHQIWFDGDRDGFGDPDITYWVRASLVPHWYVTQGDDCNDADASINPDAVEVDDDIDNDCNDEIDDLGDTGAFWPDDLDGWDVDDCDDTDPAVNPDASEVGNRVDDDCDGSIDEGLGLIASFDGSGTVWAWYGSGGSASALVASEDDYLVFSPSDADIADHPWAALQVDPGDGTAWSVGCDGFEVTSADHTIVLYEDPTLAYEHCYAVLDGGSLSGDKAGFVEYVEE